MVRRETGLTYTSRAEYTELTGEIFLNSICHQLWDNPQINWDGKIFGCCRNFWGEAIHSSFATRWIASWSLSSGAFARPVGSQ
jgi:hypothetical protein